MLALKAGQKENFNLKVTVEFYEVCLKKAKYHGFEKRNCRDIKTSLLMLKINLFNTAKLMVITVLNFFMQDLSAQATNERTYMYMYMKNWVEIDWNNV